MAKRILRSSLLLVTSFLVCAALVEEGYGQLRLFRRGCRMPQKCCQPCPPPRCQPCPPSPCPPCPPSPVPAPTGTYVCPIYYSADAGDGLHLYYGMQWISENMCANPQPLYLDEDDLDGPCPGCNPDLGEGECPHNCVNTGKRVRPGRPHDGCERGYAGPVPPRFINDTSTLTLKQFDRTIETGDGDYSIRFWKIRRWVWTGQGWIRWVVGLGFEQRGGMYDPLEAEVDWGGPKCFDITIDDFRYRVLLRPGAKTQDEAP